VGLRARKRDEARDAKYRFSIEREVLPFARYFQDVTLGTSY